MTVLTVLAVPPRASYKLQDKEQPFDGYLPYRYHDRD